MHVVSPAEKGGSRDDRDFGDSGKVSVPSIQRRYLPASRKKAKRACQKPVV
jgi:hypothetical protein